jgi:hypothetical protein
MSRTAARLMDLAAISVPGLHSNYFTVSGSIVSAGTICAKLRSSRVSNVHTIPCPGCTRRRPVVNRSEEPERAPMPSTSRVMSPRLPTKCAGITSFVVDELPTRVRRVAIPSCSTKSVRSSRNLLSTVTGTVYVFATAPAKSGAGRPRKHPPTAVNATITSGSTRKKCRVPRQARAGRVDIVISDQSAATASPAPH